MATTEDEKTLAQRQQSEEIVSKSVTKKDVLDAYNAGANYYTLAEQFFGFQNDDAVERIRKIVEE